MRYHGAAVAAAALVLFVACSPTQPDPPAVPTASAGCTVTGDHNSVNCGSGNQTVTVPSPTPSGSPGAGQPPALVKITQFGESCPDGKTPSGQDRAVRVGCAKALTLSPKCVNPGGPSLPMVDCQIPAGAAPDSFAVVSGGEFIDFNTFGDNPQFNRVAKGVKKGFAVIGGAYAGVQAEPFVLEVVE